MTAFITFLFGLAIGWMAGVRQTTSAICPECYKMYIQGKLDRIIKK